MDTLQTSVLALFFIAATAGYAWAAVSRASRGKGAAPTSPVNKAVLPLLAKPNEKNTTPLRPQALPPAREEKGKKEARVKTASASPFSFFRHLRLGKSLAPKASSPSKVAAKVPGQHRRFDFWKRGGAASSERPKEAARPMQKGGKSLAQQQVLVEPSSPPPVAQEGGQAPVVSQERVLVDSYSVYDPFVRIAISLEPDGTNRYIVVEPELTKGERLQLKQLKQALKDGLNLDASKFKKEEAQAYLERHTKDLVRKFGLKIPKDTYAKLFYFIDRDYLHYGRLDPLMRDPNIEDISCNGPAAPIFVFHRTFESIPTNVRFKTQEDLERFILRLAYMSGRHISVAEPVVDAALPEGSRIQMTFGSEITKKGSTFTIRKFREDPYSIVDLVKFGTIDAEIAATMWYALENKGSILLSGGTASGKSIAGNEPVLIYENGLPRLATISGLFDESARTGKITKEGDYETVRCAGIQTAAFGKNLKVGNFRVAGVVRHRAPPTMFKLRTRTGRETTLTGDHSAFTLVDGSVRPYPVSDLEPGMFLAVPRTLPDSMPAKDSLDLIEAFAEADGGLYVEDVLPYVRKAIGILGGQEVERMLGLGHRSFLQALRRRTMAVRVSNFANLARAAGLAIDPAGMRVRTRNYRKGAIPASLSISGDLMRLLGYWTAEGKYGRGLEIYNLDREFRRDVHRIAKSLLGLTVKDHGTDRTRMSINSRPLEAVFRRIFGLQEGAARKTIPQLVFAQQNELLAEFLRGYYTGDGSVASCIEATTKSRLLAEQLLTALGRFGIIAQMAPKVVTGLTYYRVAIYGRKNAEKFSERLGFLDRSRQRKLAAKLSRRTAPHTNIDTIPGIAPLLKQALQFKAGPERKQLWSDWHSYWSSNKRIGQQALVSYLEETGAMGELRERLLTLAYSDIFWDEIVKVEEAESREDYVYDLEVPGAQNFVGGRGGLFLHNTTTINCLAVFIRPEAKIVTIEDTPEINLVHSNWIESVSRQGTSGTGEVTLYDLLRAALRQRPDFIVVGEVRGEEANTMFQALATGHSGMSSIHADSIQAVFNRLTNPPMSIPRNLIPSVNFILQQNRITINQKPTRRIMSVTEVVGMDARSNELITNEAFKYNPEKDGYTFTGRSYILEKYARAKGITVDEVKQEVATRRAVIQWMADQGVKKYSEVAKLVQRYYTDKSELLAEIGAIAA